MNRAQAHSPRSSQCRGESAREPEVSATENVCEPEGRRLGFHNTGADAPWRAPCPQALPPGGALWSPLQRLLNHPSRRDDQQLLGPSLGSREVNSSGHTPGVNTKCSGVGQAPTASAGTSERTPNSLAGAGRGAEGPGPGAGTGPPGWEGTCPAGNDHLLDSSVTSRVLSRHAFNCIHFLGTHCGPTQLWEPGTQRDMAPAIRELFIFL